ncbi:uncharacterized protein LOC136070879 [Quercus suber]|uniref:uncharacterized protein LOC136070879 n=1 Tax=Quercus suber TaxID=58331 RepID=UPI0032DE612E
MDEVTRIETSTSLDDEVSNVDAPVWQYVNKLETPPGSTSKSGGNTHFKCSYCGGIFLGSYSRVKVHCLKISNKGIRACDTVTPSHRLEMQRMHDHVENDKLERERRSQIPLPPPLPGRGPIPSSRRQEGSGSANPVNGKRRKVTMNSSLKRTL